VSFYRVCPGSPVFLNRCFYDVRRLFVRKKRVHEIVHEFTRPE
jgi:hypothetical protein